MIVVRLKGGLGNQLFQYAFGYVLARKNNDYLKLDTEWFDTEGNVPWLKKRSYELAPFAIPSGKIISHKSLPLGVRCLGGRVMRRLFALFKQNHISWRNWLLVSNTVSCDYLDLPKKENILLNGYFDNYAAVYLKGYEQDIQQEFQIKHLSVSTQKLIEQIAKEKSATSIHVRRTDQLHQKGHLADLSYYLKAMQYIREKEPDTVFYIFSDDIDWCKEQFAKYPNIVFATDKTEKDALRDFVGMRQCKNNIIAYSTYSWWAAMLNAHSQKIVIAPPFYDSEGFLPENWIQIA